jgi:hypothetical protein
MRFISIPFLRAFHHRTRDDSRGYVCQSINCPTFYKTWTGPAQYNDWTAGSSGAVGSTAIDTDAPGTNGPRGPSEPIDYSMR